MAAASERLTETEREALAEVWHEATNALCSCRKRNPGRRVSTIKRHDTECFLAKYGARWRKIHHLICDL